MTYNWVDNPTLSGIALCDTDVLNDCLMHLKYDNAATRNIGEIVQSTVPLTDAGLHLLDGSLISGSGSYAAFVDYISDLYDSGDYTAIFETEANWQTAVSTYGVCGKFVYDSVNNTVRLPKITGFTEGTITPSTVGNLTQAGLPNITGTANSAYFQGDNSSGSDSGSGALSFSQRSNQSFMGQYGTSYKISIDASLSNSIYGNSNTVQPQSIKVLYYIVVATSTKTDIQVDIDQIATDLNGKMDSDLSNMSASQSAKSTIVSWGVPDISSGVSKSHNTLYQAETDGIIRLCIGTNNNNIQFRYGEDSSVSNVLSVLNGAGVTSITGDFFVPKGTYYKTTGTLYNGSAMSNTIIFYPLKGAA